MTKLRPKVIVIVPAAGEGKRLGGSVKKQFLLLRDKPIIAHTLQRFEHCSDVDEVAVAVPEQQISEMESIV
jgi:2-C-methyl-D-erythritol 4-phosphate cytidylyltransferase